VRWSSVISALSRRAASRRRASIMRTNACRPDWRATSIGSTMVLRCASTHLASMSAPRLISISATSSAPSRAQK
jgi:hypothetical protein